MWQVVKPLRPHPVAVGQARNFCTRRLLSVLDGPPGRHDDIVADIATVASEMVTNAISAGSTTIQLSLALGPDSVRVEVADDAAGDVVPAEPGPEDPRGRGLVVVRAIAKAWGVTVTDGTKQVWAEVPVDWQPAARSCAAEPDRATGDPTDPATPAG